MFKLSVISAVDRGDATILLREDFDRALSWLTEAEASMGDIFLAGASNSDGKVMDEIHHFVLMSCASGAKVPEWKIMNFAKSRVPLTSIGHLIATMKATGQLVEAGLDPKNKNIKLYKAGIPPKDGYDLTTL